MFVFYKDTSFKILTCDHPNFVQNLQTLQNNQKQRCREALEINFTDGHMMYSIMCFFQWFLHTHSQSKTHSTGNQILERLDSAQYPEWVQQVLTQVARGVSGKVSSGRSLKNRYSIVVKTGLTTESYADFLHEYLVAVYGTNRLRFLLPHFCYTFGLYKTSRPVEIKLVLENINQSCIFQTYIRRMLYEPVSQNTCFRFMRVMSQVILSLEVAQEAMFFTHYDLHGENILVRELPLALPFLEFPVLERVYTFQNVKELPVILDFAHATVWYQKGILGRTGRGAFPEYGMYPFYIPGADLFKLFSYIWVTLFSKTIFPQHVMGHRLQSFFYRILLQVYKVQTREPTHLFFKSTSELKKTFYNGTTGLTIFLSPLDVMDFIENDPNIRQMFYMEKQFPWTLGPAPIKTMGLTYNKPYTYACMTKLFCQQITKPPKNIFQFDRTTKPQSAENIQDIYLEIKKKRVPLLDAMRKDLIQAFLSPRSIWTAFVVYVEYATSCARRGSAPSFFIKHKKTIMYYYRAYICLEGFMSYLAEKKKNHFGKNDEKKNSSFETNT